MALTSMDQNREENLLSRWSRRKQQSVYESEQEDLPVDLQQRNLTEAGIEIKTENSLSVEAEVDLKEVPPILTDEDMPAIETLHEDSDFSGFMSRGVSDELRNLALRKLFKAPSFNFRDGLDEYDEDYTSFEKLGDIVTCDMKHQIEMEAKKKLEEEANKLTECDSEDLPENLPVIQADPESDLLDSQKTDPEPSASKIEEAQLNDLSELTVTNTASNNE